MCLVAQTPRSVGEHQLTMRCHSGKVTMVALSKKAFRLRRRNGQLLGQARTL